VSRPGVERDEPVGRRVARWRVRRRMTQQMFADRLGKSKSWVDKIERGVRGLDRYSVVREIAEVLRVDPAILLDPGAPPVPVTGLDGVDAVRAALAHYHRRPTRTLTLNEVRRHVAHAWLTYQHADYAQLLRALPALLDSAHATPTLLVSAYRITAGGLLKLGEPDLGWLAADRAVTAAAGDPVGVGAATVSVAQALRALGRDRLALTAAVAAVGTAADAGVRGTLLVQAAIAAAGCGDRRRADDLLDRAHALAHRRTGTDDPHHTAFGPIVVLLTRFLVALRLGDIDLALHHHRTAVRRDEWPLLPAEHRAAHLIDVTRAHLDAGDLASAGQELADAYAAAPGEIRCRPAVRTLVAEIAHRGPAAARVARLADLIGLTRP
jgi:transcriptional regulator with XRE-family HTH domain